MICRSSRRFKPATLLKKEIMAQMFSCEFCEIFKNTFFTEHLRRSASDFHTKDSIVKEIYCILLLITGFIIPFG